MKRDTKKEIGEAIEEISRKGFGSLQTDVNDAFNMAVDAIRRSRGEPTLEDEIAAMLEADQQHADAPPVEIGPNAACGCGSQNPLIVEVKARVLVYWDGGTRTDFPDLTGKIGTCPDCGRNCTFGA